MLRRRLLPDHLVPTDRPRSFRCLLDLVCLIAKGQASVKPVIAIRDSRRTEPVFYVCDGNHRVAAAHVCRQPVDAVLVTEQIDLRLIKKGDASQAGSVVDLEQRCREEAEAHGYLTGAWDDYLRYLIRDGCFD